MTTNSIEYNKKNYSRFWGKPAQIKARALRNKARAIMIKKGKVTKGDGKEVNHINGTKAGNGNKNLEVISRLRNRIDGQLKSIRARRENNNK